MKSIIIPDEVIVNIALVDEVINEFVNFPLIVRSVNEVYAIRNNLWDETINNVK